MKTVHYPDAIRTPYITITDRLRVYDLDPHAGELWAVAGPDGLDPTRINTDALPPGVRWIEPLEWSRGMRRHL